MDTTNCLGIYISDGYASGEHNSNPRCGFQGFVKTYWPVLLNYRLVVSDNTAALLHRTLPLDWNLEISRNDRALAIKLQAMKEQVPRFLLFLNSEDLTDELTKLWILRESAAIHGQKVHINCGSSLWAEQDWAERCGIDHQPAIGAEDSIIFVGGNGRGVLERFAKRHMNTTMKFHTCILADRENTLYIRESLHERFRSATNIASQLTDRIDRIYRDSGEVRATGRWCHVIACPGRPYGTEIGRFLEKCVDPYMRVNLLLNKATAEEWIKQFESPGTGLSMAYAVQ